MQNTPFPLSGPPPEEVLLHDAPLVKVIAQVRFPMLLEVKDEKKVSEFQNLIFDKYPFLEKGSVANQTIEFNSGRAQISAENVVIWRFNDAANVWKVSLAQEFITLETSIYTSRTDMLNRLTEIISATERVFNPRNVTRIGMRYIDQIKDGAYNQISHFLREDIVGVFGLVPPERLVNGVTEASFMADEGTLLMRCAHLAPNSSFDPTLVPPIQESSWVLDLDLFNMEKREYSCTDLIDEFNSFSRRIYAAFRWLVRDDFIKHYGGKL